MYSTNESYKDIQHRFSHHAPSPVKAAVHTQVRRDTLELAVLYDDRIPPGREKALALTNLEQAMFWANAAIARSKKTEETQ
ncbi:hypothetical protein [Mycobacterium sp. AZCC_0083]|uniref:Acb2/Tad1 domain-containing protein n=1 Tax=Mycobacterium sp. AZCC_0083 TaxID=2735882 RepID=UPI0016189295|nr:hypothetical protein [Mycobacterium sp. AZCC_0083]MBB5167139.1 hypothetical protein [Mycobacterium sp. AZCC_0083]